MFQLHFIERKNIQLYKNTRKILCLRYDSKGKYKNKSNIMTRIWIQFIFLQGGVLFRLGENVLN